jgi:N-acetylneuraminic acid mutarotase
VLGGQSLASLPTDNEDHSSVNVNYKWLLTSPARDYLSSAALQYLYRLYGSSGPAGEERDRLRGLDQIVNDRSEDELPSITTQSETTIEVSGSHLVAGFNDDGQFLSTQSLTGYSYSTDGGQTWTDGGVIPAIPKGGQTIGDPDVKADRAGIFFFATLAIEPDGTSIVGVSKSTDGGKTFSVPVEASVGVSNATDFQDKEFMTVDNSGGPHDGTIYVTWTDFSASLPPGTFNQIMISRSTDGGRHFSKAIPVAPPGGGSASIPRIGPHGELYVLYDDEINSGLRLSKSTDGGQTFGVDGLDNTLITHYEPIGTVNINCGRQILKGNIRTWAMPSLAVNPVNGDVYVTYASNPPGPDQADIYFIRSSDGGVTWSKPLRVNDDKTTSDQFFSFITVAPDGTIGISFYDRRNDPDNLRIDKYLAISRDGGRTFEPNIRLSSVSSPIPPIEPNFDPVIAPCYMADYDQVVADGQYFYATWGDNRNQGVTWRTQARMPQPREGAAVVGVGDSVLAIGGYFTDLPTIADTGTNQAFLPSANRWVDLAPDPIMRSNAAAVAYGLSAYVAGGRSLPSGDVLSNFERYDAVTNQWTALPPLPTPRAGLGLALVGDRIYAIGGRDCSLYDVCGQALDVNEAYNITTGRWEVKKPMPTARMDVSAVALKGKIYLIGGYNDAEGGQLSQVEIYDPATDSWTKGAKLPSARSNAGTAACADQIVVFGGYAPTFSPRSSVWIYDTVSDKWKRGPDLKVPRDGGQAARAGNVIYAIGGSYDASPRYAGYNEAFPCATMGASRPDPDVYFQKVPVHSPGASGAGLIAATAAPRLEVQALSALQAGSRVIFSVQGSGIKAIELQLYELSGRRVLERSTVGQSLAMELLDQSGKPLANGVYLYVITVQGDAGENARSEVRKLVVLR